MGGGTSRVHPDNGAKETGQYDKDKLARYRSQHKREETVFYDSANEPRSCCGWCQYQCCCPMWVKLTSVRVVYSSWTWYDCLLCSCPSGREMDTFDSDLITDLSAHQTCYQIFTGEGDITIWRLGGADASNNDKTFQVQDVAGVFGVFDRMSSSLSRMNLAHFKGSAMGRKMGANVHTDKVYAPGQADTSNAEEMVFYDSYSAERNIVGQLCNASCCFPHYFKFTSERVLYSQWDKVDWPCSNCLGTCCCKLPCGRTLGYFDSDLICDVQAKQTMLQLCRNEGNIIVHRLGGDQDNTQKEFIIGDVPEVYTLFDDLSYDLARLDLKAYTQNAIGQQMNG